MPHNIKNVLSTIRNCTADKTKSQALFTLLLAPERPLQSESMQYTDHATVQ